MTEKIRTVINKITQQENLTSCKVTILGKTGKGDGYLGQITFATISGKTQTGEDKTLNIAIKLSTENLKVREIIPIKMVYEKEIYIYEEVVPQFRTLQQEFGVEDDFKDLLPKFYTSCVSNNCEILVLDNLKFKGFDNYDRQIPMTYDCFKMVLEAFGKWHGLAVSLKAREPEIFKKLVAKNDTILWPFYIQYTKLQPIFYRYYEEVHNAFPDLKEIEKAKFSLQQVDYILTELVKQDLEDQVILHGDCWTNNFMFQIEENSGKAKQLTLIDFQLSGAASPVLDLSVFIYSCLDIKNYPDVTETLRIYYDSFETTLRKFNCSSDIFTFEKLLKHWKKFSCYGLIMASFLLRFSLSDSNESPDFTETIESGKTFMEFFDFEISKVEIYHERAKNNILHYLRNLK